MLNQRWAALLSVQLDYYFPMFMPLLLSVLYLLSQQSLKEIQYLNTVGFTRLFDGDCYFPCKSTVKSRQLTAMRRS